MSMPGNALSSEPVQAAHLPPDNRDRKDLLLDFELGGIALNDPSQGLQVQPWEAWSDGASVWVAPSPGRTPTTLLLTGSGITEVALSFDQNMRPTVAFVEAGLAKLFWFDASVSGMVTTTYAGASSPMLTLDDKRAIATLTGTSDVLFFYLLSGSLCYRQQRDRFAIERVLGAVPPTSTRINRVGMGANNRVQVWLGAAVAEADSSTVYTDLLTDTLYVVDTGQVLPMFVSAANTSLWRSRVFEEHDQPSFGWARVDAVSYPVTLTVLADGDPITQSVPSDEPVRLPAVRSREWQVEVVGSSRVLSVRLASSREELEADDASDL